MKLLCLNIWGGRQGQVLFDYVKNAGKDTDIFCFQEVFDSVSGPADFQRARPRLFSELKAALPGFSAYFAPAYEGWVDKQKVNFEVSSGQAIFLRQGIKLTDTGSGFIYGNKQTQIQADFINEPRNLQYALLEVGGKDLAVVNIHGTWHPGDKTDTEARIKQSANILEFLENYSCPKILCGDFNLMPETESIKMIGRKLKDLISQYHISNTRNEISWAEYNNKQYFSDYIFVSPGVRVKDFQVPYNLVSDHLPLVLDFNLE